ncbi:MAG: DNA adenine methylase [Candidatus Thermoplasmatota archaeon]|nr:DNA adenine methylase [Candidatus Thermoplasmatota archaeon]
MERLRLFKYPGSKNSLLEPVIELFRKSECAVFVDLFGGSGYVSLNIPSGKIVFNDISEDVFRVFLTIKTRPEPLLRELQEAFHAGLIERRSPQEAESKIRDWVFRRKLDTDLSSALLTIVKHTISFGGDGNTYATREKAVIPYARKTIQMFPEIAKRVSGWVIENHDFEQIIRKYDSDSVFFYLDPPYGSKRWYKDSFSPDDYIRMKESLHNIRGKYVINFDYGDQNLLKIFGDPDFIYEVEDRNQNPITGHRSPRRYYFSTNFLR